MLQDPDHPEHDQSLQQRLQQQLRRQGAHSARLVVGLVIAAVGVLLLFDNIGFIDGRYILRYLWPVAMIAVGIVMVRNPERERKGRGWGWVLITVGIWIFADKIGWVDISLGEVLFPALLLFVGGSLVWKSVRTPPAESIEPPSPDRAEFVRSFALMSSFEARPVSRPFSGADVSAVMGAIKLDLADARVEGDVVTVEVFGFWAGIEIYVPPDWSVTSKVTTLMGGFIDKRRPTSVLPTKTLIVRGMIVMSGIEVKS